MKETSFPLSSFSDDLEDGFREHEEERERLIAAAEPPEGSPDASPVNAPLETEQRTHVIPPESRVSRMFEAHDAFVISNTLGLLLNIIVLMSNKVF